MGCCRWTMQAYNLLSQEDKPTALEVDNSFDGNLCRCTGMFPILTAFKSLSSDPPPTPAPGAGAGAGAGSSSDAEAPVVLGTTGGGCCGGAGTGAGCAAPAAPGRVAASGGCCGGKGRCGSAAPVTLPPPMPFPTALEG